MSKIQIIDEATLLDYKKTAVKWMPSLLDLPIRQAADVLKFMHGVTGLRGKLNLGSVSATSKFAPFKKNRKSNSEVNIKYRTLETHLGNCVDEFSPVDYAFLPMGYDDPITGEALKNASTTQLVLFHQARARGEGLAQAILTGVYDPDGDEPTDLCDGLITIAKQEIAAGTISVEEKNLFKLKDAFTMENACDLLKEEVLFRLNYYLRRENNVLLCSPDLVDMYNESYKASHQGLAYNKTYNQPFVEGSNNLLTIIGVPELAGQKHLILTQKENMWWGTDNKSAESFVDIMRKDHYTLSSAANIFLGAQFCTIDPRRLAIIELADDDDLGELPAVEPDEDQDKNPDNDNQNQNPE